MKLTLPTRRDCKYIRQKLKIFHDANKPHDTYPNKEAKELNRALMRLFHFFQLPVPKIVWMKNFGLNSDTIGRCNMAGEIELLTPFHYEGNFENWLSTFYHEVGHYVLWFDWEKKAREFEKKMRLRR